MPDPHIVSSFDEELKYLIRRISEMGGMAERMVGDAVAALNNSDVATAERIISEDVILDNTERDIGERAILVIAKRQPMAQDLREIMGSIRIAADLERVGDLAKNIAKRVVAIEGSHQPKKLVRGLEHLAELAMTQLKEVLDAYATRSEVMASSVRQRDEEIDAMYTSLFRELLTYMMEDPRNISACTHLLFCAKNIERIGDHATNIAETVYYMATGDQILGERPKVDETPSVVAERK